MLNRNKAKGSAVKGSKIVKITHVAKVGLNLSLCLFLASCAHPKLTDQVIHQDIKKELDAIDAQPIAAKTAEFPRGVSLSDDQVRQDLVAPLNLKSTNKMKKKSDIRFDVSVTNLPAREFFMGLVADTDTNLVVNPDITGNISIALKNVTLEDVLKAVSDLYGFAYEKGSYGYNVYLQRLTTRVYRLSYLNVKRTGFSKVGVSSGQLTNSGSSSSSSGSSSSSATNNTEINTSSDSDFWAELDKSLKVILANKVGRDFIVNPQSGIVVVRAQTDEHKEIENFLKISENSLQRQVVLEAKILEVELNKNFQSGINWQTLSQVAAEKKLSFSGSNLLAPTAAGGIFGLAFSLNDFTGVIKLLEDQGQVKVLSSPRISTVNNQKAVIKVGQDEFFVTAVKSNTSTVGNNTVVTPEFTLTPFFSGIALDVTPEISPDDDITLHIHPSVSEVSDQRKAIQLGDQDYSLPLALSKIRESDSIVHAHSNQIVVIGGLLQNNFSNDDVGVPVLDRIPYIGAFFKQKRQTLKKSELVILLKPIVSHSDQEIRDDAKAAADRIRALEDASVEEISSGFKK